MAPRWRLSLLLSAPTLVALDLRIQATAFAINALEFLRGVLKGLDRATGPPLARLAQV
jgi:hypothetical protein